MIDASLTMNEFELWCDSMNELCPVICLDALELLKEQEKKPLRCVDCIYHRGDGWCLENYREVKNTDYCSFGSWKGG